MDAFFNQYPYESIECFRKSLYVFFFIAVLSTPPVINEIHNTWAAEDTYTRILRSYHVLRVSIMILQFPLRIYMYVKLNAAAQPRIRWLTVQKLIHLSNSLPWRLNQMAGMFMYVLFGAALLFAVFSPQGSLETSNNSTNLYYLLLFNLFLFCLQTVATLVRLDKLLAQAEWIDEKISGIDHTALKKYTQLFAYTAPKINKLSRLNTVDNDNNNDDDDDEILEGNEQILNVDDALDDYLREMDIPASCEETSINKSETSGSTSCPGEGKEMCSICMSTFEEGEMVRLLPCQHLYHAECVDKWLFQKNVCPLCQQVIDRPIEDHEGKGSSEDVDSLDASTDQQLDVPRAPESHVHESFEQYVGTPRVPEDMAISSSDQSNEVKIDKNDVLKQKKTIAIPVTTTNNSVISLSGSNSTTESNEKQDQTLQDLDQEAAKFASVSEQKTEQEVDQVLKNQDCIDNTPCSESIPRTTLRQRHVYVQSNCSAQAYVKL